MRKSILDISVFILIVLAVVIGCREDIFIYPEVVPNSYIYVNSEPPGAEIYHKGVDLNLSTPAWISNLEAGNQVFTLRMRGYIDTTFVISVEDSSEEFVKIYMKEEY